MEHGFDEINHITKALGEVMSFKFDMLPCAPSIVPQVVTINEVSGGVRGKRTVKRLGVFKGGHGKGKHELRGCTM